MKLKEGFITYETEGQQFMVATGTAQFSGLVRSNQTAAFIIEQLKKETTKESIVQAMLTKYDAPEALILEDVEQVLEKLRQIGALDE